MTKSEFDGIRAELYAQALKEYTKARTQDIDVMHRILRPVAGETILGVGEGNGFFVPHIAQAVGNSGMYVVTDPSKDQLDNLRKSFNHTSLKFNVCGAEKLNYANQFDKIWSFGAFHHCPQQDKAVEKMYKALKPNGEMIICDVWRDSALAEHFDGPVSEYCCTGHDVKFLGDTYAKTILKKAGFKKFELIELSQKWTFDSKYDIGKFIYKLHAMTNIEGDLDEKIWKTYEGCEKILGVEKKDSLYELNWPMKALIARK